MGFVILFNTILVIVFIKPRLGARPKGPLVEWAAFKELPYALFAIGIFLALLGLYFAYYYVSSPKSWLSLSAIAVVDMSNRSPSLVKLSYMCLRRLHSHY